jgi:hypothetical protein
MLERTVIPFIVHQEHESVSPSSRASLRAGRRTMRSRRTLVPGQKGTKNSLATVTQLVCVRYRYDAESRPRFPTVEPTIEQASRSLSLARMTGTTEVGVWVANERSLQRQVKQASRKWHLVQGVWEMRYSRAAAACPCTARSVRNDSILGSAGKRCSRACMPWKRTNRTLHFTEDRSVCMESSCRRRTCHTSSRCLGGGLPVEASL